MDNLWHTMSHTAEGILPHARQMGATGLILEARSAYEPMACSWNMVFHALALYDWDARLAKRGAEREAALQYRAELESFCKSAANQGLSVYQMSAELSLTKDMIAARPELMDPDAPHLYELVGRRFEEIFIACPHLSGVKVYLDEGTAVLPELPGARPAAERMRLLIHSILSACEKHDRKLILCTFTLMPHQLKAITDALKATPPSKHLIVDNYVCPGDWGRITLTNPAVGDCGPHLELVSFDYCAEVWGQSVVPFVQARLMADRVSHARERGARIAGLAGYVTWAQLTGPKGEGSAIGSVNEVNVHVARSICEAGDLDVQFPVREWAETTYGPELARGLTPILLRQQDSHLAAWQLLGFWVLEWPKSRMPDLSWYDYSLHWESLAIWDRSYAEIERQLFHPTRGFVESRIIPEKDGAVEAAARDLREIESLIQQSSVHAGTPKLDLLLNFFRRELLMNRAIRCYTAAFFYAKLYTGGDNDALSDARGAVADMLQVAQELDAHPDPGFWVLEPARLGELAAQFEQVLQSKEWPATTHIADWNKKLEVWGYPVCR